MRSYFYRYVKRIRETVQSESILAGKALHAELADHLRTGTRHLSALALSGLHIVPNPGIDLLVEASVNGFVTADGTPLIGQLDCAHGRGINKGGSDVTDLYDPPNTIEVIDWKWKRDGAKTQYQLEPNELVHQIQMAGYAQYVTRAFPQAQNVRLSHGMFFATRGKPRKVTKLVTLDQPLRTWEYVESLARTIKDVVKQTNPDRVDANIHACGKYGGCQHREYCTAYKIAFADQSSAKLFGETLAKEIHVGIMENFPGGQALSFTQPAAATIDLKAQLDAEEAKLRAQAAQTQAGLTLDFASAWKAIETSGRGWPALTGRAATQRASLVGQQIPAGATLTGSGDLIAIAMEDPAHVIQLGQELMSQLVLPAPLAQVAATQHVQRIDPVPNPILPPDAPKSNPAMAAQPMPGWTPPTHLQAWTPGSIPNGQQGVPFTQPITPAQNPVYAGQIQQPAPVAAPKRRGRPPRNPNQIATAPVNQWTPPQVQQLQTSAVVAAPLPSEAGSLAVYVDCIPLGEFEPMSEYVEHLLNVLCEKFIPPNGLKDVRCAPKDSPLGFGGWKGAIRAIVIEQPPPDAEYYIDTRGNEIMEVVADAMLTVCAAKGAQYVRGVR